MKNNWSKTDEKALWITLSGLVAGAAAAFIIWKKTKGARYQHEKPPRKAPQLKLENPGSQDDFPKPPMESEVG